MSISRRKFIAQAGCAAMGSSTVLSSLINLMSANIAAARPAAMNNDYKALVCILLAGGNDSYNMIVPSDTTAWNEYATTRGDLAIPTSQLLAINPTNAPSGKQFGIHPSFGGLQNLFENENLGFITNVGTLAEPIANRTELRSGNLQTPVGLFSHYDQISQWQTSVPTDRQSIGWGGRLADVMGDLNNNPNISMNISLSGNNIFQSGNTVSSYVIKNTGNGASGIEPLTNALGGYSTEIRSQGMDNILAEYNSNLFETTLRNLNRRSLDAQRDFSDAIAQVAPLTTSFSDHDLSQNMKMAAKTIAARTALGMNRQTFFMALGGFDHHKEVLESQLYLLDVLSKAMSEFYSALEELGVENQVTTFTTSDFARTLTTNGNGSDHAWGGNHIVMGGAVKGKKLYSNSADVFPSLALAYDANPLITNTRGALIPTTSVDEYFAELALWFGVSPTDLAMVLPNLSNFYSAGSGMPMGFMDMS